MPLACILLTFTEQFQEFQQRHICVFPWKAWQVMLQVLLLSWMGHAERVVQRDRVVRHLRDRAVVVHVEDLLF